MANASHPNDPILRLIYRSLGGAFLVVGLLFFAFPDGTVDTLNRVGGLFGFPDAPHLAHRFWLGLGVAYMSVVTVLAFQIAQAPYARRLLMLPLAVGKAVSSLTCLLFFMFEAPYFIYLANFLVDGSIVVIVLWTYRMTDPAAPDSAGEAGGDASMGPGSTAVLRSITEAFLPSGGAFELDWQDLDLDEALLSYVRNRHPLAPRALAALMLWFDWQPLLFHRRIRRLRNLPLAERVEILAAMESSPWLIRRQPALALKLLLSTLAYGTAPAARAIGYDRGYLEAKLAVAAQRRADGGKGPYPEPMAPRLA